MELNLVKYGRAILKVAKDLQQWTEGEYITSSGCFVLVQGVIEYLWGDYFYIVDSPVTKEVIKVDFDDMPVVIHRFARNLAENLALYFGPVPTDEELLSAWQDPRGKDLEIVMGYADRAKFLHEDRLVKNALLKFEDDKGYDEVVTPAADAGAAGSAAAEDPQPEPKKGRYGFDVRGSFGSSSAALAAIPQAPQPAAAAVTVPKSAEQKAREQAKATVDAWAGTPGVDMPFMGAGSSGFDLLGFWDSVDLGAGTEEAKAVACASFGWKASADGPERIFSSASLWSTALKNRYSVWMVELMVFLKKNKAFLPTTAEAVAEVARRKKAKRAARPAPPPRPPRPPRPPLLLLAGALRRRTWRVRYRMRRSGTS